MEKFNNDRRPACKYGENCYQTNVKHTKKYKHPPKKDDSSENKSPPRKLARLSTNKDDDYGTISPAIEKKLQISTDEKLDSSSPKTPKRSLSPSNVSTSDSTITKHTIPEDVNKFIKDKFLVDMPEDFYSFWEFCKSIAKENNVAEVFKAVNLYLVGPYDVLLGNLPEREDDTDYLVHWRYFYDPPEFQTILMSKDVKGFHMGYYRDSPEELPSFVASNEAEKDCKLNPVAENIFGAVMVFLENAKKKSPFTSISCQKLITQLKDWASTHNFNLETSSSKMKKRKVAVVSNTFHGAGIVVPFDKKTQVGYRPLVETDAKLKILIQNVIECKTDSERETALALLQPVITYANIATDECDFGGGLELGLDFFSTGEQVFHNSTQQLLSIAYNMLNRGSFEKILNGAYTKNPGCRFPAGCADQRKECFYAFEWAHTHQRQAHLKNRRKGSKLSCADI